MKQNFTDLQLLERWEARRELQNLMGRLSQGYLQMEQAQGYALYWSKRPDVALGVNDGWYAGREAVQGYYQALDEEIRLGSRLISQVFAEKLADKTEAELYGVGQIGIKPLDTFVIEIAADGQTAKGLWSVHGTYARVTSAGPVSYWDWGYYCVDFILDPEGWKIWHMQYLLDIAAPTGYDWAGAPHAFDPDPRFAAMAELSFPTPNRPAKLRQTYAPNRPFAESPPLPEPYDTFAQTFSYGPEGGVSA